MSGLEILFNEHSDQRALAASLHVSPMAISHWKRRGLPAKWALKLAEIYPHIPLEKFLQDVNGGGQHDDGQ